MIIFSKECYLFARKEVTELRRGELKTLSTNWGIQLAYYLDIQKATKYSLKMQK